MAEERDRWQRKGGQELPDEVQDRPEQNAGYDDAVRNGPPIPGTESVMTPDEKFDGGLTAVDLSGDEDRFERIDERESRGAAADVRRQDRSAD